VGHREVPALASPGAAVPLLVGVSLITASSAHVPQSNPPPLHPIIGGLRSSGGKCRHEAGSKTDRSDHLGRPGGLCRAWLSERPPADGTGRGRGARECLAGRPRPAACTCRCLAKEGEQRALEVFSYARERVRLASPWDLRFIPSLQPGAAGQRAVGPARRSWKRSGGATRSRWSCQFPGPNASSPTCPSS
jgi:hypothetical protein